jgi:hypothetical protein
MRIDGCVLMVAFYPIFCCAIVLCSYLMFMSDQSKHLALLLLLILALALQYATVHAVERVFLFNPPTTKTTTTTAPSLASILEADDTESGLV